MTAFQTDDLIEKILTLSKDSDLELQDAIVRLIATYNKQSDNLENLSRLASMGEMMDSVAHQWKQPLNSLSMMMELLKMDFTNNEVDNTYIENLETDVYMQISHMVNTLNEFRNFMRPSTKIETFTIHSLFSKVLVLLKDELISQNINLKVEIDNEATFYANPNELKHLFINIINNAIDVFNEKEIIKREITFKCYPQDNYMIVEIGDNAGGIPEDIKEYIFKANFTTKTADKGTGIGLYMCSKIVKKYDGTISVSNSNMGALFTISLPKPTI